MVNPDNDSVSRLDTTDESLVEFRLPAGNKHAPKGLSLKEDGSEVWVACHDSDRVYLMDSAGAVLHRIDLPWGSGPYSVALSPDQQRAVVTLHRAEAAAVLDVPGRKVAKILDHLFWAPMGIAWTDNGNGAWINHIFAPGEHPLQTRLDFSGDEPRVSTAIRMTPADPRQSTRLTAPYNIAEGGYLNVRGHGAQIPAASGRNELWLPTQYHNFTEEIYTPDSTIQSAIRRIHLGNRTLLQENKDKVILTARYVHTPTATGRYEGPGWNAQVAGPVDLAFSHDGKMVYVLHELSGDLLVMPTSTPAVKPAAAAPLPEIKVGDRPIGFALSPSTGRAYVYNLLSRDISIVDLAQLKEIRRVAATPLSGEPFPPTVLQGAKIFHSSDDPRISKNGKISCASCHINGEHDGRTWNFHRLPGKHGPRSVPTMLGLRLGFGPKDDAYGWGQLHRSGDRDELQDFEHTFQNIQMGGTGFLAAAAKPELGEPNTGLSPELDALADYLLFLDPLMRSPHRAADGKLTEAAVRGATFFRGNNRAAKRADAGCAACHLPDKGFQDFKFHDVGQRRDSAETELNGRTPRWHVNTPTLVGLWATAPYGGMSSFGEAHSAESGIVALLQDAAKRAGTVNHHGKPNGLTARQLQDLAAFVLSIDGNMTAAEVGEARDTHPPRIIRVEPSSLTTVNVWFNETVKEQSAENIAHWKIISDRGSELPVTSAVWEARNGDRVTLTTSLRPHSSYTVAPNGPISDDADSVSGGTANLIDLEAAENRHSFSITDRLTITLGASGYENINIAVHDTAMVGPGLSTWGHDSIWIAPSGNNPRVTTGFLRFDWRNPFQALTGVTNSSAILDASFTLQPEFGNAQRLEFRRVLQRWSDPAAGNDFNDAPTGAPTWRDSAHPTRRWNAAGAGRLGTLGTNAADYNRLNDLASRADAVLDLTSLTTHAQVAGPLVTDAFRFWFDNPTVDYGYAVRLASTATQDLKFERAESGLQQHGPVLQVTYLIPGALPRVNVTRANGRVQLRWSAAGNWRLESCDTFLSGWAPSSAVPRPDGPDWLLEITPGTRQEFFRLAAP